MNDPVIAEVRASRQRIAARWGYDLDRLADHLEQKRKRQQKPKESERRSKDRAPVRPPRS